MTADLVDAETGDGCGLPGPFCVDEEWVVEDGEASLGTELDQVQIQIASLEETLGDQRAPRQELDRVLVEQLKERAAGIEQALLVMADDAYDVCEECGRTIHPDRLAVLPGTRRCIRCARA